MSAIAKPSIGVIADHLATWKTAVVEQDIFGITDATDIFNLTNTFCRAHLGVGVRGSLFYTSSIGCTHGVELEDGKRVVIKARPPAHVNPDLVLDERRLEIIYPITSCLSAQGYPCPRPLLGPQSLGKGQATVESFVEEGVTADGFNPEIRRQMAQGLFHLGNLLQNMDKNIAVEQMKQRDYQGLYPQPHSKLFDFESTTKGAEWIDDFARRARVLDTHKAPLILGHCDWRVEHVRFDGTQ